MRFQFPVKDVNNSLCVAGDVAVMRDHDHCHALVIQLLKQFHDLLPGFRVQCSGRFISKQDRRLIHHRTCDSHPLLLPAGELGWPERHTFLQPHTFQRFFRPLAAHLFAHTGINQRQCNIVKGRHTGKQLKILKYKAKALKPQIRKLRIA